MKDAIDAHADADVIAEVFDVDVGSTELVGLVNKIVENFLRRNAGEGLGDFGDGGGVTFAGDFDVVVMNLLGGIVAEHENFVGGIGNEEEVGFFAFVGVGLAEFFDDGARGLAGNHELVVLFATALLEGDNIIVVHLLDVEDVGGERDGLFEFAGVEIGKTENAGTLAGGLLFIVATFLLYFLFVHIIIIA